jgi:NH3-dependent NAD+ synthetase
MNLAKSLGIPHQKIVISPFLKELGAYDIISHEKGSDRTCMEQVFKNVAILRDKVPDKFSQAATVGACSTSVKDYMAVGAAKIHFRMTILYFYTTLKNYLLVGTDDNS